MFQQSVRRRAAGSANEAPEAAGGRTASSWQQLMRRAVDPKDQLIADKDQQGSVNCAGVLDSELPAAHIHEATYHALKQNGVEKFTPLGEKFDPNMHSALFQLPDAQKEAGTVVAVTKSGYSLNGRVVRAAEVGVSTQP
ncbi:hypothetical protein WJX77_004249 [Trebouxia sp. C0004]